MLGTGKVEYKEGPMDLKQISRSIENAKTKANNELSPRTMFKKKSEKAPAGIKCHFYSENGKEYEDSYIT